jgi:hypothetical protein
MNNQIDRYARPAALVAGIASIIGFIALILFFALEAPGVSADPQGFHFWGFISDIAGPLTMIPLIIVMLALHRAERAQAPTLSRVALMVGVIGALGVTLLQVLLIIRVLTFEQEVGPVVLAMGIAGVWLILASYMARVQHILPSGLAWLGIVTGVAQAAYPLLFQALGGANFYTNMGSDYVVMGLASIIMLVSYLGFPIWALWFARVWTSRRVKENTGVVYAG